MKKSLVLITGGAGFIGSHTADALAKKGHKVRILDNLESVVHGWRWPKYVLGKGYELIRGDVRKKSDWARALKGVSYVYHFAAYQDQRPDFNKFFEVNTVGTALLYELIVERRLPVKKVVIASSQFVYGDGQYQCGHSTHPSLKLRRARKTFYPGLRTLADFKKKKFDVVCPHGKPAKFLPFKEDQALNPTNSYGLSKEALERLALKFGKTYGVPTTILRYSVVQGARQSPKNLYSGALRIFVTQALKGKPITVFEDGKQLRDFVNIKDVVAANLKVLQNKKSDYQVLNVGGGRAWTVLRFAELVKKMSGSESRIKIGGFRRTDTRHAVSDISKLKKLGPSRQNRRGWRPRFSPVDSVKEYLKWYQESFR